MGLELRLPDAALADSFRAGLAELPPDERASWICLGGDAGAAVAGDFAAYVERLRAQATAPPPGRIAQTTWWALRDGEMVGRISLRHAIDEALRRDGGHIGYIVRPSARRQGVATGMLRLVLATERARALGRLLLTCDEGNVASARAIRQVGGVLEDVLDGQQRFWIG